MKTMGSAGPEIPLYGKPADHRTLGLPPTLSEKWPSIFLTHFQKALEERRSFRVLLEACVHCGLCAEACPVYQTTGRPEDMPGARVALAEDIYRGSFGRWPRITGRLDPGPLKPPAGILEQWYHSAHRCLVCRRCHTFCPLGLDPSEAAMVGRHILAGVGLTTGPVSEQAASAIHGGAPAWSPRAWSKTCHFLEQTVFRHTGVAVRLPVDQPGADVLLIPSAADPFFHVGTMIGYAVVLHIAGISWTTHSHGPAAENFGLFLGERPMERTFQRIVESARHLKSKMVVWGESGHGWRAARTCGHLLERVDTLAFPRPVHIIEYTLQLLKRGAFDRRLDPEANKALRIAYHDPCHLARWTGMRQSPRQLLKAAAPLVIEMDPQTTREHTLCCGGGAGMLNSNSREFRMAAGADRARAFHHAGANVMVTACSECKFSLTEVLACHLGHEPTVFGVMEIFGRALLPYLTGIGKPPSG